MARIHEGVPLRQAGGTEHGEWRPQPQNADASCAPPSLARAVALSSLYKDIVPANARMASPAHYALLWVRVSSVECGSKGKGEEFVGV
eukprot:scaffold185883_cov31-Tisochrysis_lutea.AAC.4